MSSKTHNKVQIELQNLSHHVNLKTQRLFKTKGLIDKDELIALKTEHKNSVKRQRQQFLTPNHFSTHEDFLKAHRKGSEEAIAFLHRLNGRLDECEETFHRYNVPRIYDIMTPKSCETAVNEFMLRWREESVRGRERGWRSLNEWLREKIPVRLAEISLGARISTCVAAYFVLVADYSSDEKEFHRKIGNVVAAIGCLSVEEDRSVVIDMFLLVAKEAEKMTKIEETECIRSEVSMTIENDLVHLILREVLRLEVAFSSPTMPNMVRDDVVTGMLDHLDCVFRQKLERVWYVLDMLEKEMDLPSRDHGYFHEPDLYCHIHDFWGKLDLSSE